MAGWGRCRACGRSIWWGTSPYDDTRAFPFDDDEEQQPHFDTCSATEWVTDYRGERHRVSRCRDCDEPVWWQTTVRGKRRPMDVDGDEALLGSCHFDACQGRRQAAPEPPPQRERVYANATADRPPYEVALWLPDLELSWPVSAQEVTSQFRRLAMKHHPDMGGQASEFIRIRNAYDRLMHHKKLLKQVVTV